MSSETEKKTEEIWAEALLQIKNSMPQSEFSSWFSRLTYGEEKDGTVFFYVPSTFLRDKFNSRYKSIIENAFEYCSKKTNVDFIIKKPDQQEVNKTAKQSSVQNNSKPVLNPTLNPAYTFDEFVPGDNSNFAYNACVAISKNPGSAYNPCLIYGGVGLGKTHLLQSIGNAICAENPKAKVMYVTAENFMNDFLKAIYDKTTHQFQNKYRKVSVLLIDDIQQLQKKEQTQNELFNTFNDLYDTGRQLVFTCDRPVEELRDITDRLRSRFERGLNIDIQPPSYETRVAILRSKCKAQHFVLSDEIIEYIASNISSNVRNLEACIMKLKAYSELLNQDISLDTAKEQLKQNIISSNDTSGITIESILKTVSSYFGVSVFDLKGKGRAQSIILPRQIAMYLSRELTDLSTTEIASEFGGKNHTTVMHNVDKVESLLKASNSDLPNTINKLINQIKSEVKK